MRAVVLGYYLHDFPLGEMMRSLWLLLLIGCEKMDEPGALFSAVEVEAPAPAGEEAPAADPDFDFPEPEVISSEELQSGNFGNEPPPDVEAEVVEAPPDLEVPGEEPAAVAEEVPAEVVEEPPAAEPVVAAASMPAAIPLGGGWPVRLVKTLPETNPPRAIIGLPSGEERVVSPGSMLPEHGLVVIAIGPSSAQVARVTPQGDHAAISPMTLQTMY